MKKSLLITITFLFSFMSYAQIRVEKTSNKSLDEMVKNIDKSDFTSGILLDRSGNYSNLAKLNALKDPKPINYGYFKQALLDLHVASKRSKLISSKALKDDIKKNKTEHHVVDIGIISADYHSLNYNNKDKSVDGLKLNGDVFKSIKNKKSFLSHTSLVASPLKMAAKGSSITYRFQSKFWFNTSKKTIQNLTISFENGKDFEIIKDGKIIRNKVQQDYDKTGEKVISFRATYSDMTTLSCASKIYIIAKDIAARPANACIENGTTTADIAEAFQGYDETSTIRGQIDYRIYFRTNTVNSPCTLAKPIIIIDGFDPGDRRRIEDTDCANDPDCASKYTSNGQFDSSLHTSIRDFLNPVDGSQNLGEKLQSLGYDVILVNNPTYQRNGNTIDGGADYIERNGRTLTRLIRDVNSRLATNNSNEQLVIVGPSMGGQISRYALAYMEQKYEETNQSHWQHNTRLWISVDSPHLGANIPLGVQALLNQVKNENDAAQDFVDNQLGSPASKQQLIEQYETIAVGPFGTEIPVTTGLDGRTISQGYSVNRGASFFQIFYNNVFSNGLLGSKGYPLNLRKIALVNGAMNASRNYESIHEEIPNDIFPNHSEQTLNIRGFQEVDLLLATADIHIASLETFALPNYTSYSKISRFKKLFNDTSIYMTNNNSRGNMDNASGGWFDSNYQVAAPVLEGSPHNINFSMWSFIARALGLNIIGFILDLFGDDYWSLRKLKPVSSFIPSYSAIGHLNPDTNWAQALDKNLVCQNLTPFDSYFGHSKNTQHTTFNTEARIWLIDEIEGTALEPYFPVNPDNLVGASTVCSNEIKTYTFLNCAIPGDVVNWSTSFNIQILSSTANSITIRPPSDSRSAGWIKATFSNGVTMQKNIWIGKPSTPSNITGPTTVNTGVFVSYTGLGGQGETSYNWELPGATTGVSQFNTFSNHWQYQTNPGRIIAAYTGRGGYAGYVKFSGINICGESDKVRLFVEHGKIKGGNEITPPERMISVRKSEAIKIYPVPTKNLLNIQYKTEKHEKVISIELFNHFGRLVLQKKTTSSNLSMDTTKLKDGNYILKITTTEQTINRKIIIQH